MPGNFASSLVFTFKLTFSVYWGSPSNFRNASIPVIRFWWASTASHFARTNSYDLQISTHRPDTSSNSSLPVDNFHIDSSSHSSAHLHFLSSSTHHFQPQQKHFSNDLRISFAVSISICASCFTSAIDALKTKHRSRSVCSMWGSLFSPLFNSQFGYKIASVLPCCICVHENVLGCFAWPERPGKLTLTS